MDCPRCGGRLDRYELADRVEASCDDCGYVGVPVDHGSERPTDEPWTDVVERYGQAFDGAADVDTGPAPPAVPDDDGDPQPHTVRTTTAVDPPADEGDDHPLDGAPGDEAFEETRADAESSDAGDEASEETPADVDGAATDDDPPGETDADATGVQPGGASPTDEAGDASDTVAESVADGAPATDDGDPTDDTDDVDDRETGNGTGDGQRAIDEYAEKGREAVASPDAGEDGDADG